MLMQNFKAAADLGITEPQFDALQKTLVLLETGKLRHVPFREMGRPSLDNPRFDGLFNMACSQNVTEYGTVGCIKGTAELISDVSFCPREMPPGMISLFYKWKGTDPNSAQAATALRSYLTTGEARWDLAVAS